VNIWTLFIENPRGEHALVTDTQEVTEAKEMRLPAAKRLSAGSHIWA
jgi:hypothetical protein